MASKSEFLANAYNAAREAGLSHTAAQVAAAQAAHESRYGKSAPGNNFFGIKAGKSWTGKTQKLKTWEVVDGKKVSIKAKFRAYTTPAQSFQDWAKTIARKWPGVLTATTFTDAVKALKAGLPGGYATDNLYNQKMAAYEKQLNSINLGSVPTPKDAVFDIAGQTREQGLAAPEFSAPVGKVTKGASLPAPLTAAPVGQVTRAPLSNAPGLDRSVVPSNPGQLGGLNYGSPPPATPSMMDAARIAGKTLMPGAMPLVDLAKAAFQQIPNMPKPAITPPAAPVAPIQAPVAPAQVLAPALPPPVTVKQYPVAQAQNQFPAAPPTPRYTPSDIYGGQVGSAMSTGGNTVSRVAPNGSTYVTNQYGVTTATTPDGKQAATNGIPAPGTISGPLFGGGIMAPTTGVGQMAKTGLGAVAGAGLGSFFGPVGSLLGAALGKELAKPNMGRIGNMINGTQSFNTNAFGNITAAKAQNGLSFPDAPNVAGGPRNARDTNNSLGGMRDISPKAADAIGKGLGGLY